ncbi:hypothetical protein [Paenibacillus naphthalenovorans]|uniref:hypothetical protein n=1 Tax=Paenibacillus naphthalenovorans TaxID=162209 RepID=UPI003D2C2301
MMAYNTRNIAKDGSNQPVPQYYNPTADAFEPVQGSNGASNVQLTGSNVKDAFSGSANVTKNYLPPEYPTPMRGFSLVNDGAPDVTFTIGGKTITVKQNETFDGLFDPFTSVTVTATGAFRAVVKG